MNDVTTEPHPAHCILMGSWGFPSRCRRILWGRNLHVFAVVVFGMQPSLQLEVLNVAELTLALILILLLHSVNMIGCFWIWLSDDLEQWRWFLVRGDWTNVGSYSMPVIQQTKFYNSSHGAHNLLDLLQDNVHTNKTEYTAALTTN